MKKLITGLITIVLFIGIPACCGGFFVIEGIETIRFFEKDGQLRTDITNVINSDTVVIDVEFDLGFYSDGLSNGTMASSYAFSCQRNDSHVNKITSIDVFCSSDFNGIQNGKSLRPLLLVYNFVEDNYVSLDAFEQRNNFTSNRLTLIGKPINPNHNYTIKVLDDNDHEFTFTTEYLFWQ